MNINSSIGADQTKITIRKTLRGKFSAMNKRVTQLDARYRHAGAAAYGDDVHMKVNANWNETDTNNLRKVMRQRSDVVQAACQRYRSLTNFTELKPAKLHQTLRWVKDYKFIWCPIFKCASTTWVKNLLLLANFTEPPQRHHALSKELYPPPPHSAERNQMLRHAKKLIIVRHPLDRLLSAYRDKMLRNIRAGNYETIQLNIARSYKEPQLPPHVDLAPVMPSSPNQPSFNKFLLRVRDDLITYWDPNHHKHINLHWRPFWAACSPCNLKYDIIAKVETLHTDQEFIVRDLHLPIGKLFAESHSS
ncbi:carbohydrate sulfotransferase 13, partial [Hyalella azteca]|uniref:Carbohydrate sulfotransferase n=1 Tax=Hyalella azteca TaxID=294128 RepID=A0A8B7N0S8_HYAAZ